MAFALPKIQLASDIIDGSKEVGVRPSMGSVRDAYDHATCESSIAKLELELFGRRKFRTKAEASMAVFQVLEGVHSPASCNSALGDTSPTS